MRHSTIKSIFRIDYKALLPALILSAFLLICLAAENGSEPASSAEVYSQFELKSFTGAKSGEQGSRGMATNPVSKTETVASILAASLTTSTGNQSFRDGRRSSRYSNIFVHRGQNDQCRDKNTLSMVDSELGRQFTLLGEKPSGTS